MSERSEFRSLPIFGGAALGSPQGQRLCGRLSLPSFFGEAKKEGGRRATPGNWASSKKKQHQLQKTKTQIKKPPSKH
ncbi:hypothetical protein ACIQW9_14370 [Herminiimonas sp. NPDC097707]|uniref:hypothetical protein n=1 Tax=Herminiimonas sp. NPDC097707 TaxID=3364007 RepID=UPI00383BE457